MTVLHRVKVLVFGDEAQSKEERRLVQKLDFFILTYCCFSFFFNYLDRAAFANAYVSGLKESLNLTGDQYNVLLSIMTAGYVIGQIPHGLIIQKVPPRIWLSSMVTVWAGLTMLNGACKTYTQLCVVRFFQGLVEASTYCSTLYIIGSWYKPLEIAKRTSIFTASGQAGTMFAGVMMTAIREGMEGYSGLQGWQWVFIIDGIITLPIAILGFVYFPDIPQISKAPYLSPTEIQLAISRLPEQKRESHSIDPWSLVRRVFTSPAFYILTSFSLVCGALEAFSVQGLMLLYMDYYKSKFPSVALNTYPLGIQAVAITANLAAAIYIDATNRRVPIGVLSCLLQLVSAILLLIPSMTVGGTFVAFYLSGTAYMVNPLLFGWANVICQRSGDDALRSMILFSMNASAQILYTFWGIALYGAADAPYWRNGCIAMIVVVVVLFAMLWLVSWLDTHSLKNAQVIAGEQPLDSKSVELGDCQDTVPPKIEP